ncbi:MAG: tripartite tricarboxylate transporter substrate binding protein [Limnobacter sp.]|nr:tripartite tricarboxylate transporter substrate binding protein [Limnobacter sp.]
MILPRLLAKELFPTGIALVLAYCSLIQGAAYAKDDYPTRPVKLVVPYPPGGGTDAVARILSDKLATKLGQPFIVDNKPGAAGIIGTDSVAKAKGDGYTLVVGLSNSLLTNQFLYSKLPYSPTKDFALVYQIASAPLVLAVHPSVPVNDVNSFIQYLQKNKGALNYGSYGTGSYSHLASAQLSKAYNADMTHIPYKGEAPMIQELLSGGIQMGFASTLVVKQHLDAGKLKVLGVSGAKRVKLLPNVPTLSELGLKDEIFDIIGWIALAAPASTPKPIQQQLARELGNIVKSPEFAARVEGFGFEIIDSSPERFQTQYNKEMPVWERLIRQADIRLD